MNLFEGFHSIVPFLPWRNSIQWSRTSSFSRLHDYTRWDSSVQVISSTQRPLPDNTHTQHLQETNIHTAGGIRTRNPSKHAAAGIGYILFRLDFSQQIFENSSNKNFVGTGPAGVELFQTDERTDRHNEDNSRFSRFGESA